MGRRCNVKKKVIISIVVAVVIVIIVVAVCGSTPTHYSIAEIKTEGWPGHKVSIDVARISPFSGGVSYSETQGQYAFFVYDKTATYTGGTAYEDIVVIVKSQNINFTPQEGDFIRLTGELQASDIGTPRAGWRYDKKAMTIYVFRVERTTAPADWGD